MIELGGDPVGALLALAPRGLDLEAKFFDQGPADETPHRMCLPARRLHDLGQARPLFAPKEFDNLGGFATLAGDCTRCLSPRRAVGALSRRLLRPWLLRCGTCLLWRNAGRQALDRLPNSRDGGLPVREFLNRLEVVKRRNASK